MAGVKVLGPQGPPIYRQKKSLLKKCFKSSCNDQTTFVFRYFALHSWSSALGLKFLTSICFSYEVAQVLKLVTQPLCKLLHVTYDIFLYYLLYSVFAIKYF